MPLTVSDRRYYAGLFDGEANISLIKQRTRSFNGYRYRVEVGIGQVHGEILHPLIEEFGGSLYIQSRHRIPNARPIHQLRWFSIKAHNILVSLQPFLRMKQKQAVLALEAIDLLSALRGGRGHRRPYPKRLVEIYEEMKQLNKRGKE